MTPAAAVQARAAELRGSQSLGIATDALTYPGWVLVGISRPGADCVLQVPRDQYDGLALAAMAGFDTTPAKRSAMERAGEMLRAKEA